MPAANNLENEHTPQVNRIKDNLKEWLFCENIKDKDFDNNADELRIITESTLGYSNFNNIYRFFHEILFDKIFDEKGVDVIVALSRRAHLLLKIFLIIIVREEEKKQTAKKFEKFPVIITDKGIEVNADKIKSKNVVILDETAIFGRTLKYQAKKVGDIQKGYDNSNLKLRAYLARRDMLYFERNDGKNILKEENDPEDAIEISYNFLTELEVQKDLLYRILKVFYHVGVAFTPILPIVVLNQEETDKIINEITTNKDKYYTQLHYFVGAEHYLAYEKYDKKIIKCFRVIKKGKKSHLLPAILQPDLKITDVDPLFRQFPEEIINSLPTNLGSLTETKYRLICYFLEDAYLRGILKDVFGEGFEPNYAYNGLSEHLRPEVCNSIKDLHDNHENKKITNTDMIIEKSKEIIEECQDCKTPTDYANYAVWEENKKIYRNITTDYVKYISSGNLLKNKKSKWQEIKEDFAYSENIYSLNAFTSYILKLSVQEDYDLRQMGKCVPRQGYDGVRYLITTLAKELRDTKNIASTSEESLFLENEIFAIVVFFLDFGILAMNTQSHNPYTSNGKDYQNIGVMLRPGEHGDSIPKYFAQAYEYCFDFILQRDDSNSTYKDVHRGLLVKNLLEYWAKHDLPRSDNLNQVFTKYIEVTKENEAKDLGKRIDDLGKSTDFVSGSLYSYAQEDGSFGIAEKEDCLKIAAAVRKYYMDGKKRYGKSEDDEKIRKYAEQFKFQI